MTDAAYLLQAGTIIAGRFEIVRSLGSGSMGVVYACLDRELSGRVVAIKVLFPEVSDNETNVARFRNEIIASYRVSHPNVIRSFELIRDGDLLAYTMEYVEGGILLDFINPNKLLPINTIIRYVIEMCAGVQAIHDAGIVHRDLKPENILITQEGSIKIADFGIARTNHGPKLTEHGGVVGTIDYVSPEYILESKVDWRSDIYALGILIYELITGQSPFTGDSMINVITDRLNHDPSPPSEIRPEASPALDQVVLKALARDPEERYQSAAALAADLVPLYQEVADEPLHTSAIQLVNLSETQESFQGPALDQETVNALVDSDVVEKQIQQEDSAPENANFDASAPTEAMIQFEPAAVESEPDPDRSSTVKIKPEVIDIAAYYKNNDEASGHLESVLGKNDMAGNLLQVGQQESVVVNSTSLNVQDLSELRHSFGSGNEDKFSLKRMSYLMLIFAAIGLGILGGILIEDIFVQGK